MPACFAQTIQHVLTIYAGMFPETCKDVLLVHAGWCSGYYPACIWGRREEEGKNLRSGQNRLSAAIRDSLKACIKTASAAGIGKYAQKTF
ncbi:MAG: hypothetical protein D3914_13935 [Candidatus Electrothrix sp. LOE2]|nr:hypothetical protein [Candidatus Electrothrix sp. LOE2]